MNPAAPVTNVVARVSVAIGPVCCLNEAVPTDNTRTELVRRPYTQVWRSELARAVVDEGACRVLFAGLAAVAELRVPCAGDC
jgi:hypothetical protein